MENAAVVLCCRRRAASAGLTLCAADCGGDDQAPLMAGIFGKAGCIRFDSGWEVLVGQAEVVNFLKSSPSKLSIMRYAGEWKLAGGNVDDGEDVHECALRELHEEFLAPLGWPVPQNALLRPFVTKQTRPVRSRSNLMHCYVALWDENEWLQQLDVEAANAGLAARRERFADLVASGQFWQLTREQKERVAPEVRRLEWLSLRDAVGHALSSMTPGMFVNDFQRHAFSKYKRKQRDPMFITAATMMELEAFPDAQSLIHHCESVDLLQLTVEEQWLFPGMRQTDVDAAFADRLSRNDSHNVNPSFKDPAIIARQRRERLMRGASAGARGPVGAKL